MPGQHVDNIYEAALNKLYYEPLSDLQLQKATDQEIARDERLRAKNDSIGSEVFADIEASNLTPQEKQEVHLKLAQYGMTQELENPNVKINPATLLRGNNRYTNYTTAYLSHYGAGYVESIRDLAFASSSQVKIPKSVVGRVDKAFSAVEDAYTYTNAESLRDNVKKALKSQNAPDNVINQVDQVFNSKTQGGLRPVDQSLKDDMDEFLRKNQIQPGAVEQEFQGHYTRLQKAANLAGGQIPPQDMPPNGELVAYLDQHGLSRMITPDQREALKGVTVQDFQTLHKIQTDIAHKVVDATGKNLSQLSPEARKFLESAFQPVTDDEAINVAGSSTLVLRLTSPKLSSEARNLTNDPSSVDQGVLLERGVKTVQRYVNSIGAGSDKQDYATLGCNDLLKDGPLKTQTLNSMTAVAEGQDLDTFSQRAGGPLSVDLGARNRVGNLQVASKNGSLLNAAKMAKLDTESAQLIAAQKKLERLNRPGPNFEKFKALLQGGVKKVKQATSQDISNLEKDLQQKVSLKETRDRQLKEAQLNKQVQQRKQQLENNLPALTHNEATDLLNALNKLNASDDGTLKLSPEQAKDLLKNLDKLSGVAKQKKGDSLRLSDEQAGDLLKALDKMEGISQDSLRDSLKLSDSQANNLLQALNKMDGLSKESLKGSLNLSSKQVDDLLGALEKVSGHSEGVDESKLEVSDEDLALEGLDLSSQDVSDLLGALRNLSPESLEQVEKVSEVETSLTYDQLGDLIKELEELDLSQGPEPTLDDVAISQDELEKLIQELEEFDPSENVKETHTVGSVLHGDKHETNDSQKLKVNTNSLRSQHPELLHHDSGTSKKVTVKTTLN